MEMWQYILQAALVVLPIILANWNSNRKKEAKIEKERIEEAIKRKERQAVTDDHQCRTYRRTIEKIFDKIHENPGWIIRRDYYKGIEEDFEAYIELGGNGYIVTLMEDIREYYKNQEAKQI